MGTRFSSRCRWQSRCSAVRLIFALAVFGMPSAATAKKTARRATLLVVYDDTGRASVKSLRDALTRALGRKREFAMVSHQQFLAAADAHHIPVGDIMKAASLATIAPVASLDIAISARLAQQRRSFRAHLQAVSVETGKVVAKASISLSKPALSRTSATTLVATLMRRMPAPKTVSKKPPALEPKEEDAADPWGTDDVTFAPISADPPALADSSSPQLRSRVEAEHFIYATPLNDAKIAGRNSVEYELSLGSHLGGARADGSVLFRRDFADPSRDRFDVTEAFVEVPAGPFTLTAGRMLVSWGSTTMATPTDVMNPIDMRDPLDPEKLGTFMIRLRWLAGPVMTELLYLPVPEAHLLPLPSAIGPQGQLLGPSRWVRGTAPLPTKLPVQFHFDDSRPPAAKASNSQAALRVATSLGAVDLSLSYGYLFDRFPTARYEVVPDAPTPTSADVYISYDYLRQHVATFDLEFVSGGLRLAAEAIGVSTEGAADITELEIVESPDPYATLALAIDYRTPQFSTGHTLHFIGELILNRALRGTLGSDTSAQLRFPLTQGLLARVAYEIADTFEARVNAVTALDGLDLYVNPGFTVTFAAGYKLHLEAAILYGEEDGNFGRFDHNNRLQFRLEAEF